MKFFESGILIVVLVSHYTDGLFIPGQTKLEASSGNSSLSAVNNIVNSIFETPERHDYVYPSSPRLARRKGRYYYLIPYTQRTRPKNLLFNIDLELLKLTEELFDLEKINLNQFVELKLQHRLTGEYSKDLSPQVNQPLFETNEDINKVQTVSKLKALYNYYVLDGNQPENFTLERKFAEEDFLDRIMESPVMERALDWLAAQQYVGQSYESKMNLLNRIWFNYNVDNTTCGFERIFLSEFFETGVVGMQNWIYFDYLEKLKGVKYLHYVDIINLSGKGSLLRLNYKTEDFIIRNATLLIGTSPELEMALYTICFVTRPNEFCPVSLDGIKFAVYTHSFERKNGNTIDFGFYTF